MEGAAAARKDAIEKDFAENDAMKYAAIRNILLRKGKVVEVLANYEPGCITYQSGGNSFTEKVREKIRKVFSRRQ